MRKTFKFRLYPTPAQVALLEHQLAEGCRLYNAALQERRDAWRMQRKSVSFHEQAAQIKLVRADGSCEVASHDVCNEILRRLDRAFKNFFSRASRGEKGGFPRFRSFRRFDSLTFSTYGKGTKLRPQKRLYVVGVGEILVRLHRPIDGEIKAVTVKREAGRWYACFSCVCPPKPLPPSDAAVGIDVGLSAFATLSDGTKIENPRFFKKTKAKLRRAQRKVARRKKGSHRRKKAVQELQRLHVRLRNQRNDFQHKVARRLVNAHGLIAVEDLNIKGLAGGMLAGPVNDAAWAAFIDKLAYKAEGAGRELVKVDPRGTSQTCPRCAASVPKTLSVRRHECGGCGLSLDRDHASALEILGRGRRLQSVTQGATLNVG